MAPPQNPVPTVIVSRHPAPPPIAEAIAVRWCKRLGDPAGVGGHKAPQSPGTSAGALASGATRRIFEGLMCDTEDRVVCATSANLFARLDGRWLTPRRRSLWRRGRGARLGAGQCARRRRGRPERRGGAHADALLSAMPCGVSFRSAAAAWRVDRPRAVATAAAAGRGASRFRDEGP